jgi:hypothetical protein
MLGAYANFFTRTHLVSHVDSRRRIVAHANGGEARLHFMRVFEVLHFFGNLAFDLIGDNRAVK